MDRLDRRGVLRRLTFIGALAWPAWCWSGRPIFPPVRPRPLRFPEDHGAHPDFRTEWWYATGWLEAASETLGFQVTFFRSRTDHDGANPSRFAPRQLLFAHAALAQPAHGHLRHEQRAARVVTGDAAVSFATADTDLRLRDWRFRRDATTGVYLARVDADSARLDLELVPTQALLLQGEGGFSRKGSEPDQASHYYSQPQLAVRGRVDAVDGKGWRNVQGRAWLDHEWSSRVLDEDAAGWDWLGVNLDDGGALMAFRIRSREGKARWAAARWRDRQDRERSFGGDEVRFEPLGEWRSPRTGAVYPVRQRLRLGDGMTFEIVPLMEDQELDSRASTGAVYWEGAVRLEESGRPVGRGYLELVGYHRPMRL